MLATQTPSHGRGRGIVTLTAHTLEVLANHGVASDRNSIFFVHESKEHAQRSSERTKTRHNLGTGTQMANWYGASRSNYFLVKDREVFTREAAKRSLEVWADREDGRVGVCPGRYDDGCWPSSYFDAEDNEIDFDVVDFLVVHLADGEVCVLMQAGAEKLCYVTGWALAFTNSSEIIRVDIDDIYDLAKAKFGVDPTLCQL